MTLKTEQGAEHDLPEVCGARNPATDAPIMIRRGQLGYYHWPRGWTITPEEFNAKIGCDEAQMEAMIIGSMRGWPVNVALLRASMERGKRRVITFNERKRKRWSDI